MTSPSADMVQAYCGHMRSSLSLSNLAGLSNYLSVQTSVRALIAVQHDLSIFTAWRRVAGVLSSLYLPHRVL